MSVARRAQKVIHALLRPIFRTMLRVTSVDDPWERLDAAPRLRMFGSGLRHDFRHFLAGESTVSVHSLDDVLDWLAGCRYESDEALFHEPDFWQHPVTFERLRAGDCEDFALWAWRKLLELGYDAELVVGRSSPNAKTRHAWVVFRRDGREYLLEPTVRDRARMLRDLSEVRASYVPEAGVGPKGKRFGYAGALVSMKRDLGLPVDMPVRPTPREQLGA